MSNANQGSTPGGNPGDMRRPGQHLMYRVTQRLRPVKLTRYATQTRNRVWRVVFALAFAALATTTARVALATVRGQNLDGATRFALSRGKHLFRGADAVALGSISMKALVALTVAVFLVALLRRRWQLGARVFVLVAGANLSTQVLKHWVLHRPDLGVDYAGLANSLPSGHSTVAMSAALGILLVAPLRARSMAAFLGWATASFVGVSVMLNEWHRLSDVLVAFLVAGIWGVLLAPRERVGRRFGHLHRVMLVGSAVAALGGIGMLALAWVRVGATPLGEPALRGLAAGDFGWLAAGASAALIVGLSGLILAIVNTQARAS